jgi:hypothetical protein
VARVDVNGLGEAVQKLQVSRLKGLILTIGPNSLRVILNWNHFTTQIIIKKIEQTSFQFHNFYKSNLLKTWELRPKKR